MIKNQKRRAFQAQELVEKFNKLYPVGSTVQLRKVSSDRFPYEEYKVKKEAFCTASFDAVAFFEGISGYFSIDTDFIKYPSKTNQKP